MTDTKLSAACSLHTASVSTSSSTSSRKKRLVEIAEEEEDEPPSKRKSVAGDLEPPKTPVDAQWNADPVTLNADLASSPEQSKFSAEDTTEPPTFVGADERPTTSDSYDRSLSSSSSYPYGKPKVKLGPRPSLDVNVRPQTAGNFRPVSAIPAGYKLFGKGSKRNKSRDSNILVSPQEEIASMDFAAPEDDASKENTDPALTPSNSENALKPAKKISPEKARLKKAMLLREKKRLAAAKAAKEKGVADAAADAETIDVDAIDAVDAIDTEAIEAAIDAEVADEALADQETPVEAKLADQETPVDETLPADQAPVEQTHSTDEPVANVEAQEPAATPSEDPEVFVDAQSTTSLADQTSEMTADSQPASPALGDSETAHSTKASSISDATEQTAQENGDKTPSKEAAALAAVAAVPERDQTHMTSEDHIKATEAALFGSAPEADEEPVAIPISKFSTNNSNPDKETEEAEPVETKSVEESTSGTTALPPQLSAHDLLAATRAAAEPNVETPAVELAQSPLGIVQPTEVAKDEPAGSAVDSAAESKTEPAPAPETEKERRRGFVEPIQTAGISHEADENHTPTAAAVIAEADAPAILETPVTPVTPESGIAARPLSTTSTPQSYSVRTVSNPVRGNLVPPSDVSQSSARSMSSGAAYLHKITQQQQANANLSSKSNVGSSISQRIKALEMLSASSAPDGRPASRERPQSTFFSVKKTEPLRAPSVIERASSLRMNAPPSRDGSDSSPETSRPPRGRSGSISNRLSMFQPAPDASNTSESISVTAKIIRDPNQQHEPSKDTSGFNPLDLKQSPLFVSHQKPQEVAAAVLESPPADSLKDDGRRSSVSLVRGLMKDKRTNSADSVPAGPQSPPANGSFSPRLSFSSRRSTGKEEDLPSPDPDHSGGEDKSGDGKVSRASRFMRRLSTLSGSRSKNTLPLPSKSPLAHDEPHAETSRPSTTGTSPWIVSYLGDVNVQFPDNLLWKRRNMCIDSQGFLVLSALPAPSSRAAQGTKRYHLSEFRPPYCPDVEVQELPNSVVLDFVEGTSLQLACEDRSGQLSVLNDLTDAHAKHDQFGK